MACLRTQWKRYEIRTQGYYRTQQQHAPKNVFLARNRRDGGVLLLLSRVVSRFQTLICRVLPFDFLQDVAAALQDVGTTRHCSGLPSIKCSQTNPMALYLLPRPGRHWSLKPNFQTATSSPLNDACNHLELSLQACGGLQTSPTCRMVRRLRSRKTSHQRSLCRHAAACASYMHQLLGDFAECVPSRQICGALKSCRA